MVIGINVIKSGMKLFDLIWYVLLAFQIDYVDGASSGPPRLRSRGHAPKQPPVLPSKANKPCVHKQHRTHPAPVAFSSSELKSNSEVTLGPHVHHSHRVLHHHHQMPVYMPGGHIDVQFLQQQQHQPVKPPSSRGSHSSDTSSAYSGSDTMQARVFF